MSSEPTVNNNAHPAPDPDARANNKRPAEGDADDTRANKKARLEIPSFPTAGEFRKATLEVIRKKDEVMDEKIAAWLPGAIAHVIDTMNVYQKTRHERPGPFDGGMFGVYVDLEPIIDNGLLLSKAVAALKNYFIQLSYEVLQNNAETVLVIKY